MTIEKALMGVETPTTRNQEPFHHELDEILRRPAVERVSGLSTSSLYEAMKRGDFPRPVKLGPRAVGWRLSEVRDWLASLPPATDNCEQPEEKRRPAATRRRSVVRHAME